MSGLIRRLRRWAAGDRGSAGGFALTALIAVIALLMVLGLVVDGGAKAAADDRANRVAMEAARAGAEVLTSGSGSVDDAVQAYLATEGVSGVDTVTGNRVDVTVHFTMQTKILSMLGSKFTNLPINGAGFAFANYAGAGGGP